MPDNQTPEKPQTAAPVTSEPKAEEAAQYVSTEVHTQTKGVESAGNEEDQTAEAAKEHGFTPEKDQALKTETPIQTTIPEKDNNEGNLNTNMTNFMAFKKAKLDNEIVEKNITAEHTEEAKPDNIIDFIGYKLKKLGILGGQTQSVPQEKPALLSPQPDQQNPVSPIAKPIEEKTEEVQRAA
jgi:hypothetical protein